MKMKGTMASVAAGVVTDLVTMNSSLACYVDAAGTYDPSTSCTGGFWVPQDTVTFKDDNIEGVCQGTTPGNPITVFPDTTPLAVDGMGSFPDDPTKSACP